MANWWGLKRPKDCEDDFQLLNALLSDSFVCEVAMWLAPGEVQETSCFEQEKWDRWRSTEKDKIAAKFQVKYAEYNKNLL